MFSDLVVAYLFLGGTGGGACVVIGVLGTLADGEDLRRALAERFRGGRGWLYGRFFGIAAALALGTLLLGIVCLMADVGRPDRILLLLASRLSTYLAIGAWALMACATLALVVLLVWAGIFPAPLPVLRVLHVVLGIAGLVTVVYTGLLLSGMPSVPLWNSLWLVAVFALSGLSCGLALVLLSALAGGTLAMFVSVARCLVRVDTFVIALEIVALALWLASVWFAASNTGEAATPTDASALSSVSALCVGSWASWLWLGLGLVGLVLPVAFEVSSLRCGRLAPRATSGALAVPRALAPNRVLAASLCVLVGGALLRYLVVAAGALPVPSSPF